MTCPIGIPDFLRQYHDITLVIGPIKNWKDSYHIGNCRRRTFYGAFWSDNSNELWVLDRDAGNICYQYNTEKDRWDELFIMSVNNDKCILENWITQEQQTIEIDKIPRQVVKKILSD